MVVLAGSLPRFFLLKRAAALVPLECFKAAAAAAALFLEHFDLFLLSFFSDTQACLVIDLLQFRIGMLVGNQQAVTKEEFHGGD